MFLYLDMVSNFPTKLQLKFICYLVAFGPLVSTRCNLPWATTDEFQTPIVASRAIERDLWSLACFATRELILSGMEYGMRFRQESASTDRIPAISWIRRERTICRPYHRFLV